jgi:hypothetical protein
MKKFFGLILLSILIGNVSAQEKFGKTLNVGAGLAYYGYVGGLTPGVSANFEFDLVKNVTLAPFVAFYTYTNNYYGYDPNFPGNTNYHYRETVIPFGVKGSYYFDDLLNLPSEFDLYAAASAGFNIRTVSWDNGYNGGNYAAHSFLYADVHAGGEYHFNKKIGFYADLSTGLSTVGIALHLR